MIASRTSSALLFGFKDLFYFLNLIGLNDVFFLDIVEILNTDTAFESGLDFLDVILEPSEGTDLSVIDDYIVAKNSCPGVSFHTAVEYGAACNHPEFWNMKGLSYFRPADHVLFVYRLEHADYGAPDVIEELIDDIIVTNVHRFLLGQLLNLRIRSYIEADHDSIGGRSEHNVGFGDRTGTAVNDVDLDFGSRKLDQRINDCLQRTMDIGFDYKFKFLDLAFLNLIEQVFESNLARSGKLLFPELEKPVLGDCSGLLFIGQNDKIVTRVGHPGKTENLDRNGRLGRIYSLPASIEHIADPSRVNSADINVTGPERPFLNQDCGNRPPALVQLGLDDSAPGHLVRVGLEFKQFGLEEHHFEQFLDPNPLFGRYFNHCGVSTPFFRNESLLGEFTLDSFYVGVGLVDFVYGHNNRYLCGFGVIYGLDRLLHDAVIGRYHQDDCIGNFGAPCAHGCKSLMARSIQKYDITLIQPYVVSPYVLGNASSLPFDYFGISNCIEQ